MDWGLIYGQFYAVLKLIWTRGILSTPVGLVCFLRDSEIKDLQKNEKRMRTVDIDHVLDAKPLEANNNTNLHANASYLIAQQCI